jgi:hypothetical protein
VVRGNTGPDHKFDEDGKPHYKPPYTGCMGFGKLKDPWEYEEMYEYGE